MPKMALVQWYSKTYLSRGRALFCIHPSSTLVDNRTTTSPSKSVTIKTMNYNQNHSIDLGGVEVEFS